MKVLVSDFDGTLFDKNFKENIKIIEEFVNKGNIFVIATGRNISSLRSVINLYNIPFSYIITNDGGIIFDSKYNEIYRHDLDEYLCKNLYKLLDDSKLFEYVFFDTGYCYEKMLSVKHNRVIGKIINRKAALQFLKILNISYNNDIYAYLSNNWLNITCSKNNKLNAIQWLSNINNWNKDSIYVIGDDINDLEMLNYYRGYLIGDKIKNDNVKIVNNFKDIKEEI